MSVVKDISLKSGVSLSTVSLVLNNKPGISDATRQRVLAAAAELGYQNYTPRGSSRRRTASLQFIFYKKHGLIANDTPFFSYVLEGVEHAAKEAGYQLLITYFNENRGVEDQLKAVLNGPCSGIILLATEMTRQDMKYFTGLNIPVVVLDSYFEEITLDSIVINNMQGAYIATQYLYDNGHTEIGYLKSKVSINNFLERQDGYKKALKTCDIPYNPEYVFQIGASVESAYADMKHFLEQKPVLPTAFFADNDNIAIGAMRALRDAGYRIPKDISVIGFDDIPFCEMVDPPLSTIRVPKHAIGGLAITRLIQLLQKETKVRVKMEVHTDLVERQSVSHPPRK